MRIPPSALATSSDVAGFLTNPISRRHPVRRYIVFGPARPYMALACGTMKDAVKRSIRDGNHRLLHWLGSHEVTVLLAVAGIAAGVWIFAALAGEVGEGDPQVFDRTVLLALRQPGTLAPLGPPAVQDAWRDITALG